MARGPSGTVTFLFTDIEGSTRLWEESPEQMRVALARHDEIVRGAIEGHGGFVFATGGDGFAAAFETAGDAVASAVAAHDALGAKWWDDSAVIRVRMGLHSGEVDERGGDYFGAPVNRTARLMAVGHGGQILCTDAVAGVTDVATTDLGGHRLRDLSSTVRVFQLDPHGHVEFPALRTIDAYRGNLPAQLTDFVGRGEEVKDLVDALNQARVVTVVGVGGVGKTRLATQVAAELLPYHRDGAWLVEFAPVLDPDRVPDAVASAFGYLPPDDMPVLDALGQFFAVKDLVVVLDNCEHLLRACAELVTSLAAQAPDVKILCTSREALGIRGERAYPVPSLTLPAGDTVDDATASEAVMLFTDRAADTRGTFEVTVDNAADVAGLCRQLDGIPLAIELAAARTNVMSPHEILDRLDQRFRLLAGRGSTALERHQTLRTAVDWSYDLLSDDERLLLDASSVFIQGFDLHAAVAVGGELGLDEFDVIDHLDSLVAKSLIVRTETDAVTRYRLLETIRQYAAERLQQAGTVEAARDAHSHHYLQLAAKPAQGWLNPESFAAAARFDADVTNIVTAIEWTYQRHGLAAAVAVFDIGDHPTGYEHSPKTLEHLGRLAIRLINEPDVDTLPGFVNLARWAILYFTTVGGEERRPILQRIYDAPHPTPVELIGYLAASAAVFDSDIDTARRLWDEGHETVRASDTYGALMLLYTEVQTGRALSDQSLIEGAAEAARALIGPDATPIERIRALQTEASAVGKTDPDRALACIDEIRDLDHTADQGFWVAMDTIQPLITPSRPPGPQRLVGLLQRLLWTPSVENFTGLVTLGKPETWAEPRQAAELVALIHVLMPQGDIDWNMSLHPDLIDTIGAGQWRQMFTDAAHLDTQAARARFLQIITDIIQTITDTLEGRREPGPRWIAAGWPHPQT